MAGARAEFEGRIADAQLLYQQAWDAASDDYEAAIAAHYRARHQADPHETFRWNERALAHANAADEAKVQPFFGSLYVNMGYAYELLGNEAAAERYYVLAAALGVVHRE